MRREKHSRSDGQRKGRVAEVKKDEQKTNKMFQNEKERRMVRIRMILLERKAMFQIKQRG